MHILGAGSINPINLIYSSWVYGCSCFRWISDLQPGGSHLHGYRMSKVVISVENVS